MSQQNVAHTPYQLSLASDDVALDVLRFEGHEQLSQPFRYQIEFTCAQQGLTAEQLLNREASFLIYPPAHTSPEVFAWQDPPQTKPLRALHGVITGLRRLSGSPEEAHYEAILEPRFAQLGRGNQYRIHQQQSVPEIVESILRTHHGFRGEDFLFDLHHTYPRRAQVMQYGESDLAFISRLLAEVGIWYRITRDERLNIEVVQFHDHQRFYQFGIELPHCSPGGLSTGENSVWQLQTEHKIVEKQVAVRAYDPRDIHARLHTEVDKTRSDRTTYGEDYRYAEPYTELGDKHLWDIDLPRETGEFFARIRHELHLNQQTLLNGVSTAAHVAPAQVLTITGNTPEAFQPRCVITVTTLKAARDQSLLLHFTAIPYSEDICFRPPLIPKPQIPGTLPARITTSKPDPTYAYLDLEGRYRVTFLFDRDSWKAGRESMLLRLARPYAGTSHGLHLPLLPGTEVAIAFEQGDPDRPYIAHALHDNKHPDLVTHDNHRRNVLRTPANNTLRLDDTRGEEHIKLSTDHSGKSQLNLGHIVDREGKKRGEGFELRTDGHGAIRSGCGVLISAGEKSLGVGDILEMTAALNQLAESLKQINLLSGNAKIAGADPADTKAPEQLKKALTQLEQAGLLATAPAGIALTTPAHLQLAAGGTLTAVSENADHSILKRFTTTAGGAISFFAQRLGIKVIANQGPVKIQAQNGLLQVLARNGVDISCTDGEVNIVSKKKIVLNAGSNYLTLDPYRIELGSPGEVEIKAPHFYYTRKAARMKRELTSPPPVVDHEAESQSEKPFSG